MEDSSQQVQQEQLLAQMGWIRGLARSLVADPALADDISQEAWIAARTAPPSRVQSESNLRAWLSTVVHNLVRKSRRSSTRRNLREVTSARLEAIESTADVVVRGALHRDLTNRVMDLDEPFRTAILLHYLEELPTAEVATRLNIAPDAARKRISRGMKKLRQSLDAAHDGDRQAWTMVLVPFIKLGATPSATTTAWVLPGTIAMTFKISVAVATICFALFALFQQDTPEPLSDVNTLALGESTGTTTTASDVSPAGTATDQPSSRAKVGRVALTALVTDAMGKHQPNALVLFLEGKRLLGSTQTDLEGRFDLASDTPGADLLIAPNGGAPERFRSKPIEDNTTFQLSPAGSFSGVVTGLSSPESIRLQLATDRPSTLFEGLDDSAVALLTKFGCSSTTTTISPEPNGNFAFSGLAPNWSGALLVPKGMRFASTPSKGAIQGDRTLLFMDPVQGLRLPLEQLAVLTGVVRVAEQRTPIPALNLIGNFTLDGKRTAGMLYTTTDAAGAFEVYVPMRADSTQPWLCDLAALDMNLGGADWEFDSADQKGSPDLGVLEVHMGSEVRFQVLDPSGAPIEGATGFLQEEYERSGPTDAFGRASMLGLQTDSATLAVSATGYEVQDALIKVGEELVVTLEPARTLRVVVTQPKGAGRDSVFLQIKGEEHVWTGNGPFGWLDVDLPKELVEYTRRQLEGPIKTDKDGAYEIGPLRPGVVLTIDLIDFAMNTLESLTFVVPRDVTNSEIVFGAPVGGHYVEGVVLTDSGRPLPRAQVHVQSQSLFERVTTDWAGRFSCGPYFTALSPVTLDVSRPDYGSQHFADLSFDEFSAPIEVILTAARKVEVDVVDAAGRGVRGSYLSAVLQGHDPIITAKQTDGHYVFKSLPLAAGVIKLVIGGEELSFSINATQTQITLEALQLASLEITVPSGTPFAKGARVNLTWQRVVDGVAGEEDRHYFRKAGDGLLPLKMNFLPGEYILQIEQRVLSRKFVEKVGDPLTFEFNPGDSRALEMP